MNYPKISVITVSFNHGPYIEESILSVLNQNYPNLEYIIIDGGSTDNTIEVLKKYENHFTYWVSEPDKGQSEAMNKGYLKSTGDLIVYLNSDDVFLPDVFNSVAKEYIIDKDILILGYTTVADINLKVDLTIKPGRKLSELIQLSRFPMPINAFAYFYSPAIHKRIGLYNTSEKYAMDYEFLLKAFQVAHVIPVELAFGIMRSGENSLSFRPVYVDYHYHIKMAIKEIRKNNIILSFFLFVSDELARYVNHFDASLPKTYRRLDVKFCHKYFYYFDKYFNRYFKTSY